MEDWVETTKESINDLFARASRNHKYLWFIDEIKKKNRFDNQHKQITEKYIESHYVTQINKTLYNTVRIRLLLQKKNAESPSS